MWKDKLGSKATYRNLILAFESAGYGKYGDIVRQVISGQYCLLFF